MGNLSKALGRWKEALLLTAIFRVLLLIFSVLLNPHAGSIFDPWIHWDGPHYLEIARNGYQTQGEPALFIVFYPLYPFLVKIFSFFVSFNAAAVLVPTLFSFAAAVFLYELARLDWDHKTALFSVWFLNIFPTSYFLQGSYTESLFLATALATVYFFRRSEFWLSGLFGFLSTLGRVNGILLLPVLFMEGRKGFKELIGFAVTPLGFLTYLLINKLTFGDFFYFTKPLYNNWFKRPDFPWNGIKNLIDSLPTRTGDYFIPFRLEVLFIFLTLALSFYVFFKVRKSYGVFMFLNWILFTSTSFILSIPRYCLILFPIFLALAQIKNKLLQIMISLVSLVALGFLSYFYLIGKWAF